MHPLPQLESYTIRTFEIDCHKQLTIPALVRLMQETAEELSRKSHASRALRTVSNNAAILYHTGQLNQAQTIEYIQTHALASERRAQQSFRFLSNPLFRSYLFTYTEGYALIDQATADKTDLFKRLLTEPILPSQLSNGSWQHVSHS